MRGVYTFNVEVSGVTHSPFTMMMLQVPSNMVCEILSVSCTNKDQSTSEQLDLDVSEISDTPTNPTFAGIANVKKHESGDATNSVVASGSITDSTTEPTYETNPIHREGFNNLAGVYWSPLPEERPIISPSKSFGIRLMETPSNTSFSVNCTVREIGG